MKITIAFLITIVLVIVGFAGIGSSEPATKAAESEFAALEQYRVTSIPEAFQGTYDDRGLTTYRLDAEGRPVSQKDYPYDPQVVRLYRHGLATKSQTVIDATGVTDQKVHYNGDTGKPQRVEQGKTRTYPHMFACKVKGEERLIMKTATSSWVTYRVTSKGLTHFMFDPFLPAAQLIDPLNQHWPDAKLELVRE